MAEAMISYPVIDAYELPHFRYLDEKRQREEGGDLGEYKLSLANELAEYIIASGDGESGFATFSTAMAAMTGVLTKATIYDRHEVHFAYDKNLERASTLWSSALHDAKVLGSAAAEPYYEIGDYDDVGLVLPYAGVKEGEVVCEVFRFKLIDKKYYDAGLVFGGLRRSLVDEGKIETNANLRLIESRLQTTLKPSQLSSPHRLFSFGVPEIRRLMSEGKAAYRRDVAQYEIDTRYQFRNLRYPVYRNYGDFAKLDAHIEELRKARVSMGLTQGVPIKSYLADLRAAHALETARHTS